jgi:hypothetical protein
MTNAITYETSDLMVDVAASLIHRGREETGSKKDIVATFSPFLLGLFPLVSLIFDPEQN